MLTACIVFYSILFSVLTNCFLAIWPSIPALCGCIAVFALFNLTAGLVLSGVKSKRLRVLAHGNTLLLSFCFSVIAAMGIYILVLFGVIKCEHNELIYSIVYCVLCNFILFWNGILCVYLASVQLGIKYRVIGLICGLIPVVNLVALGVIIAKTDKELRFEKKKEKVNAKRAAEKLCATKYPILLVHGVFFRDFKVLNYWGRVPAELEKNGAVCYYGNHHSAASVENCGKELAARIREIVEKTGAEKVNIIAHSKGGLDCRFAMEHCGIAPLVASFTTVNTPHRGCVFADWLMRHAPSALKDTVANSYNKAAKLLGDSEPDFLQAIEDLCADKCTEFDKNTLMPQGVYCQSIGSVMKGGASGRFPLNLSYHFVKLFDGKNDGLVGEDSFAWSENYTLIDLPVRRGVSHADMIDLNRENIDGFDVREFYVKLVNDLKQKGF